jgi:hypothetical protein
MTLVLADYGVKLDAMFSFLHFDGNVHVIVEWYNWIILFRTFALHEAYRGTPFIPKCKASKD